MTAVIIGMTNPHSEDPAMALYPHPEGSAGWRLWKMMDAVYPTAKLDYATRFRRINLLTGEWSLPLARKAAGPLLDTIALGDEVVVLGNETWEALELPVRIIPLGKVVVKGTTYYKFPHTSGRNRYYNDEMNRWWAGSLLAQIYKRGGDDRVSHNEKQARRGGLARTSAHSYDRSRRSRGKDYQQVRALPQRQQVRDQYSNLRDDPDDERPPDSSYEGMRDR
jgi:hypothetical protein